MKAVPPLKTVIVAYDYGYVNGGQAKVAIESAKGLALRGFHVVFFCACGPVDETLVRAGIEVVCLGQEDLLNEPNRILAASRGIWNLTAARELGRLLRSYDPDTTVVHCHGFAKALSPAIGPELGKTTIPTVFSLHEYFLACPNGGFFDFRKQEICRRKPLGLGCLSTNCDVRHPAHKAWRVVRQAMLWGVGAMPKRLRNIIYISPLQLEVLQPYLPTSASLHYLPNPVFTAPGNRVHAEQNDIYLFTGRLSAEKGPALFAAAARVLGVEPVFVGDGPARVAVNEANPDARITGWLSPSEVQEWIAKARVLVFPSLWYECFPLAPLDALARGVPVVTGAWNAASSLVHDGETGVIVRDQDVSSWASAISTCSRNVERLSRSAYKANRHKWSLDTHLNGLVTVFEAARSKARGSSTGNRPVSPC